MQACCWCELTLKARDRLFYQPFFILAVRGRGGGGGGGRGEKTSARRGC